jgi:hypothetical protein
MNLRVNFQTHGFFNILLGEFGEAIASVQSKTGLNEIQPGFYSSAVPLRVVSAVTRPHNSRGVHGVTRPTKSVRNSTSGSRAGCASAGVRYKD